MTRTRKGRKSTLLRILLAVSAITLVPRSLPAAWMMSLDAVSAATPHDPATTSKGQSFTGSAYFFADGAFTPVRDSAAQRNAHTYRMENGPAAPSIFFQGITPVDRYRATNCLAAAIYYEAGNESEDGQRAVAQAVLNRVRHPAWPNSVCAVVYQGSERIDLKCQFSFSCDGAMGRLPNAAGWRKARRIATDALAGQVFSPVGMSTYYHTLAVSPPWSANLQPVAVIGAHIFYRWQGAAGHPAAFTSRYARFELQSGPALRATILPAGVVAMAPPVSPSPTTEPTADRPAAILQTGGIRPEYLSSGRPLVP